MTIDKIIVIGNGSFAFETSKIASLYLKNVEVYESNMDSLVDLSNQYESIQVDYHRLAHKDITKELKEEGQSCLIISALSTYIIPKEVLIKENVVAVNYHNAILPYHRGRNAEAWAIFDQDDVCGITWHYVDSGIDTGDILFQDIFEIDDSMISISLLQKQNACALNHLPKVLDRVLKGQVNSNTRHDVTLSRSQQLHLSKDRPNGGVLDLTWDGAKISAFLRAYDYRGLCYLGRASVFLEDLVYSWKRYKVTKQVHPYEVDRCFIDADKIVIEKGIYLIELLKCEGM